MLKGSLSIFTSMILASVLILLLTMAECVRIYTLQDLSQEYVNEAAESAFSEYNPYLWANYGILAVDFAYGSDTVGPSVMESRALGYCGTNASVDTGYNYTRLTPELCQISNYSLLTDNSGEAVIMLGSKYAMEGLPAQLLDGITTNLDLLNNIEEMDVESEISKGTKDLNDAKDANQKAKDDADSDDDPDTSSADYPDPGEVEDNPLDAFSAIKESFSKGVLSTVIQKDVALSEETVELDELPSYRELSQGTMESTVSNNIVDKALFIDYLLNTYSYYGQDRGHDGLDYEIEYLIGENESDSQNLASVVERILLVREAANYTTILRCEDLKLEAAAVAEILAGFTMNPAIIQAVKYAIIGAWAYAESTLDLRLLLDGGKVPAIKTREQWTTDVWHLSAIVDVGNKAKESSTGLTYKDYLMGMLAIKTNASLGLACCDIMENALNATGDYANVKLDNMTYAADISITFSAKEMFLSIFSEAPNLEGNYNITKHKLLTY